jgi:hypothetical protein
VLSRTTEMENGARSDGLNARPTAYKAVALPLSYAGKNLQTAGGTIPWFCTDGSSSGTQARFRARRRRPISGWFTISKSWPSSAGKHVKIIQIPSSLSRLRCTKQTPNKQPLAQMSRVHGHPGLGQVGNDVAPHSFTSVGRRFAMKWLSVCWAI